MKLLFVGTNRGPGGTESHLVSLARAMADAGHSVAAAVRPGDYMHGAIEEDPRISLLPARTFRRNTDLKSAAYIWRAASAFAPQVIIGSFEREYQALTLIGRLKRTPVVLFRHLEKKLAWTARKMMRSLASKIVVPSYYLRGRLIDHGLPSQSVAVLYNPVDTAYFRPSPGDRSAARHELGVRDDDVVVAFVGRFEGQKGVFTLSTAFDAALQQYQAIRPLWVGHGESEAELRRAVAGSASADRHIWRPWASDVASYYRAADIVVMPSERHEAFGRTMVEAQSCGVPVLGSDSAGIPETMMPGVTGRLVTPGDAVAWAHAITCLAKSPQERAQMGRAGRSFVTANFDSPLIAHAFTFMLSKIAGR